MILYKTGVLLSCVFIRFGQNEHLWTLGSPNSSHRNEEIKAFGKKLWVVERLRLMLCLASCLQNNVCWFILYERHNCYGYSTKIEETRVVTPVQHGLFRRFVRPDNQTVPNNGFQLLSMRNIHVYAQRHDEQRSWQDALQVCRGEGATLIKIDCKDKQKLLNSILKGSKEDFHWIGLRRDHISTPWLWADGTNTVNYTHWIIGQSNNKHRLCAAACARGFTGRWYSFPCEYRHSSVCEKIPK